MLSDEDIADIECQRVVAMEPILGLKLLLGLTGFVWTIVTRQLAMKGV